MDTIPYAVSAPFLYATLGLPHAPLLFDVRRTAAWQASDRFIASAVRRDPECIAGWSENLPRDRPIIVYCVHGHEVSQNACLTLRATGRDAHFLEGGIESWQAKGLPTVFKLTAVDTPAGYTNSSLWVTRERPKIDRIACPWLIRRFIDPTARFCYVPAADVLHTAAEQKAIAFDIPGVQFTHRDELCSFDALLADFGIDDPSLTALARIVRGADTGAPEMTPQSAGLLAVSLGLSALYADDQAMLEQGITVYDALYAWLKTAANERHNADLFRGRAN